MTPAAILNENSCLQSLRITQALRQLLREAVRILDLRSQEALGERAHERAGDLGPHHISTNCRRSRSCDKETTMPEGSQL